METKLELVYDIDHNHTFEYLIYGINMDIIGLSSTSTLLY